MDSTRRRFRSVTAAFMTRALLTVALILIVQLNQANAFAQGTWTTLSGSGMPTPRWWSAAIVSAGDIGVVGGFTPSGGNLTTDERFPVGTPTAWGPELPIPSVQTAPAYAGGAYVAGGNNGSGPVATLSIVTSPFAWSTGTSMPTARQAPAGALGGSLFYVMGGNTGSAVTGALEAYNPSTDSWTSVAPMLSPRSDLGADTIDGIIYAAGGSDGTSPALATLEAYDPATNTWATKASMPTARADLAVVALYGLLYAIGGRGADGSPVATVEAYNPVTDTWATLPSMPTARWGLVAIVASFPDCGICSHVPAIYAIGGALDAAGTTATGANEFFVPQCGTVNVTPTSLSFRHKRKQTVTVTNTGSVNVGIFSASGIFAPLSIHGDTCSGNVLVPSASCTITVKSSRLIRGALTDTLTINDSACENPQTVTLSGAKTAAQ